MNRLPPESRIRVISALIEGCSVRSTARLTGVAKSTILRLLPEVGRACAQYQGWKLRGLKCRCLQLDEIWSFCAMKQKRVPEERQGEFGVGDVWTWTALD